MNQSIKIKICGITRVEDAIAASKLGAWGLGFIFVKSSPRFITPDNAANIISHIPGHIKKIGVFANSSTREIASYIRQAGISIVQLHGNESPEFCLEVSKNLNIPIIKAIRIDDLDDLDIIQKYKNIVTAILLDTYNPDQLGGTGETFDWNLAIIAKKFNVPIILAGGLNPENIKEALKSVQPFGLDVSSGVEKTKGIKDHDKLNNLFKAINAIN